MPKQEEETIKEMFKFTTGTYKPDGTLEEMFGHPVVESSSISAPQRLIMEIQQLGAKMEELTIAMAALSRAFEQHRTWAELEGLLKNTVLGQEDRVSRDVRKFKTGDNIHNWEED